ncbi:MAG: DNA polymerase III subunit alpha [Clostridia bacterium]|nr:DNA polymerase III subunit alpha [Clostridia bacterium]
MRQPFVHLHVHSPFSFLDGASSLERLVEAAAGCGMPALALTDHDRVSGAVRFARLARRAGLKPIQGAEVTVEGKRGKDGDGSRSWPVGRTESGGRPGRGRGRTYHLILLAMNPKGYANLCQLLTRSHLANPRRQPCLSWEDLEELNGDLIALSGCRRGEIASLILERSYDQALKAASSYLAIFGRERFYLELEDTLLPGNRALNQSLLEIGEKLGIKPVATNNVHYVEAEEFPIHDLLTCIRTHTTVFQVHPQRRLNGENYFKSPAQMEELFSFCPRALAHTLEIAEICQPALESGTKRFPRFPLPPGETSIGRLRALTYQGARRRYQKLTAKIQERLEKELSVIERLGYADYFLLMEDVMGYARRQGIRGAGRGSAGASAVAYCLGLTEVDPIARDLLFERFMSLERAEAPDIDLDFDSRYRDRVAEYVYQKYGPEHVASVATYCTYQARSAVRDGGRALGMEEEVVDALAKSLPPIHADEIEAALEKFPETRCGSWKKKGQGNKEGHRLQDRDYELLFNFCAAVAGFPRFLGTHLGGLVVSGPPLTAITPLEKAAKGMRICQFDRDDVEELGLVKLDLLSLKAFSLLEDAAQSIRLARPNFSYERLPLNDAPTYRLISRGDTVGVFQLESPAQRALQARLGAKDLEDIVASLALIRPGPIKGNMVDPFVARRRGREPATYLHPRLVPILEKTYGVVLFQEQVIAIATELAGFSPGEADRLRRLMTHSRSRQEMQAVGEEFVRRATQNGIDEATARAIFSCLEGYASYGFCEAHAAAFAITSYWTAYLSAHYPAPFFAALLNHQPMGFYGPGTLATIARSRGIKILGPDINLSGDRFTVEGKAIRVPLSQVRGMRRSTLERILAARQQSKQGRFSSVQDFFQRSRPEQDTLENLILCGALDSLYPNRRQLWLGLPSLLAIWGGEEIVREQEALEFAAGAGLPLVPDFEPQEKAAWESQILGLEISCHLMQRWRQKLIQQGYADSRTVAKLPGGRRVKVAGLPIRPHRPPTRSGRITVFLSLEDEWGLVDVTVFEDVYQKYGHLLFGPGVGPLRVEGITHRRGRGVSILAQWLGAVDEAWELPTLPHLGTPGPGKE